MGREQGTADGCFRLEAGRKHCSRRCLRGGPAFAARARFRMGPWHRSAAVHRCAGGPSRKRTTGSNVSHCCFRVPLPWAGATAAGRQKKSWPLVGTLIALCGGDCFRVQPPGLRSESDYYSHAHLSNYFFRSVSAFIRGDVYPSRVGLGGTSRERKRRRDVDAPVVPGRDRRSSRPRLAALEGTG